MLDVVIQRGCPDTELFLVYHVCICMYVSACLKCVCTCTQILDELFIVDAETRRPSGPHVSAVVGYFCLRKY